MDDILREIKERKSFLVTTHMNPEGDAIGSALALAIALNSAGKEASLHTLDPIPKNLRFLPRVDMIKQVKKPEGRFDAVITVDCGDLERVGFLTPDNIPADILINIDHHVTNRGFGDLNLVRESVASAEIVYEVIRKLDIPVTPEIATCVYTAILTETGSFRYSNTDIGAFQTAGEMVRSGADPWAIAEQIYNRNSMGRLRLLGLILSGLHLTGDGRIGWITVREEMYKETGTTREDVEDLINFPRSIEGVEVAVLFRESNQDWKISLRSNGKVNVAELALEFGGGGHSMAAGFLMKGAYEEIRKRVIDRVAVAVAGLA